MVIYLLFALVCLMGGHSLWWVAQAVGEPFGGFLLLWRKETQCLAVHPLTSPSWPGIQPGRLHLFDCLIQVGDFWHDPSFGAKERGMAGITTNQRRAYHQAENKETVTLDYLVAQHDRCRWVSQLPVFIFTWDMYLQVVLPHALFALGLLSLAFMVYRADPVAESNVLFALNSLYLAAIFGFGAIYDMLVGQASLIVRYYAYIHGLFPLMMASLFHLGLAFPAPEKTPWLYRWRYGFYVGAILLSLPHLTTFIWPTDDQMPELYTYSMRLTSFLVTLSVIAVWGRCYWLYRTQTSPRIRLQAACLMVGWGIGVIPIWVFAGFHFLTGWFTGWLINYAYLLILIFALCVAYATLRYQLFPGYTRQLRYLLLSAVSIFLAVGYYLLFELLGLPSSGFVLLWLILTTWLTSFLWTLRPHKGVMSDFFNRLLHREQGDLQAVTQLNETLYHQTADLSGLGQTIADNLYHTVEATNPRLWLTTIEPGNNHKEIILQAYHPQSGQRVSLDDSMYQFLLETARPLRVDQLKKSLKRLLRTVETHQLDSIIGAADVAVIVPLVHQQQLIGLITLGPRWTEEVYSDEDLALLHTMARQTTLAILTAQQIAELRQYPSRIAEAQEGERERLAKDLHDSIQQFLAGLPLMLHTSQQLLSQNPPQAEQILQTCSDHALAASNELRAIRRSLSPQALSERGLVQALRLLVDSANQYTTRNHIRLTTSGEIEMALNEGEQLALYRVIQQAVDNALKHAQADSIEISLQRHNGRLAFMVRDNGRGFDPAEIKQRLLKGHDGLQIMRDRLDILGGHFSLYSEKGIGTTIQATVPLNGLSGGVVRTTERKT